MKTLRFLAAVLLVVFSLAACQQSAHHQTTAKEEKTLPSTGNFGKEINLQGNILPVSEIGRLFGESDSLPVKVSGLITSSCKHSGCWMELDMGDGTSIHVTFRDEAFTIPLDAAGKKAVAEGMAFRELIPVETLQDYAREDGKTDEEIAAITQPVWEYEYVADGVIIME